MTGDVEEDTGDYVVTGMSPKVKRKGWSDSVGLCHGPYMTHV